MRFNPRKKIKTRQPQEVIFSRMTRKEFHPNLYFNYEPIENSVGHKYVELTLGEKQSLTYCIHDKINKNLKDFGLFCKLSMLLP